MVETNSIYGVLACYLVKGLFKKELTPDVLKRTVVFFRKWLYFLYKSIGNSEWIRQLTLLANLSSSFNHFEKARFIYNFYIKNLDIWKLLTIFSQFSEPDSLGKCEKKARNIRHPLLSLCACTRMHLHLTRGKNINIRVYANAHYVLGIMVALWLR